MSLGLAAKSHRTSQSRLCRLRRDHRKICLRGQPSARIDERTLCCCHVHPHGQNDDVSDVQTARIRRRNKWKSCQGNNTRSRKHVPEVGNVTSSLQSKKTKALRVCHRGSFISLLLCCCFDEVANSQKLF
jgi:hypothetical protein